MLSCETNPNKNCLSETVREVCIARTIAVYCSALMCPSAHKLSALAISLPTLVEGGDRGSFLSGGWEKLIVSAANPATISDEVGEAVGDGS